MDRDVFSRRKIDSAAGSRSRFIEKHNVENPIAFTDGYGYSIFLVLPGVSSRLGYIDRPTSINRFRPLKFGLAAYIPGGWTVGGLSENRLANFVAITITAGYINLDQTSTKLI